MTMPRYSISKGNTGVFMFDDIQMEVCHLKELPIRKSYLKGETIAISGNTGSATTAPHCHIVLHKNIDENYQRLTSREAFLELVKEKKLLDPFEYFQ